MKNFISLPLTFKKFKPVWYEAKEEVTGEGKTVWFHGFEILLSGELWNIDLWFFDQETIDIAEACCDDIMKKVGHNIDAKEAILNLKTELMERGFYSFEQYNSMDVYDAVLEFGIRDVDSFCGSIKSSDKFRLYCVNP